MYSVAYRKICCWVVYKTGDLILTGKAGCESRLMATSYSLFIRKTIMSIIDKKKKPLATGTFEQEIAEINLLLSEVGIRLRALGLRLVCSIEEEKPQGDDNED